MDKTEEYERQQKAACITCKILANLPLNKWETDDDGAPEDDLMDWLVWTLEDDFNYDKKALERRLVQWASTYK